MIRLSANWSGFEKMRKGLRTLRERQIPIATAMALTSVAKRAQAEGGRQIRQVLDRPTNFATSMLFIEPAKKTHLESMVYVKDFGGASKWRGRLKAGKQGKGQARTLGHLFRGGQRSWKGLEAALMRAGVLPRGMTVAPGAGLRLDAHGNMPRGFAIQMMAYFGASFDRYTNMDSKARVRFGKKMGKKVGIGGAAVEYFVSRGRGQWFGRRSWKNGRRQHLPPGIWMRASSGRGTAIKPILMFVRTAEYRRFFDLPGIARTEFVRHFRSDWKAAMARALETAW